MRFAYIENNESAFRMGPHGMVSFSSTQYGLRNGIVVDVNRIDPQQPELDVAVSGKGLRFQTSPEAIRPLLEQLDSVQAAQGLERSLQLAGILLPLAGMDRLDDLMKFVNYGLDADQLAMIRRLIEAAATATINKGERND